MFMRYGKCKWSSSHIFLPWQLVQGNCWSSCKLYWCGAASHLQLPASAQSPSSAFPSLFKCTCNPMVKRTGFSLRDWKWWKTDANSGFLSYVLDVFRDSSSCSFHVSFLSPLLNWLTYSKFDQIYIIDNIHAQIPSPTSQLCKGWFLQYLYHL